MVPKGTTFDYTVKGSTTTTWWTGLFTVAEFEGDITNKLSQLVDVNSVAIDATTYTAGILAYQYTARVRITTRFDHAKADDVKAIVRGAFQSVAGAVPSTVSETRTFAPGSGASNSEPTPPFDFGAWLSSLLPDVDFSTALAVGVIGVAAIVIVLAAND